MNATLVICALVTIGTPLELSKVESQRVLVIGMDGATFEVMDGSQIPIPYPPMKKSHLMGYMIWREFF